MCGFVVLFSPSIPIRSDLLDVMRDRLIHRGPDNGFSWIDKSSCVGLAHRRLSIIDRSHGADQPMESLDGSYRIVFNGELYNYLELRKELIKLGMTFRTQSDTEVLLAAYQTWGKDVLSRLNGMFAFAVWDANRKEIFVARDRFGEKPLFIGRGRLGTVVIASEMKAILAHPLVEASISSEAMERFGNSVWYEDDELTFFNGIERFPPAHAAIFNVEGEERYKWRYWTPDYSDVDCDLSKEDATNRFAELLERSVKMRLRADVNVGSSLSGGLDSSTIVGILAGERNVAAFKQNTFSACFPDDPTISEENEIDEVVEHTGVNCYKVSPDPKRLAEESMLIHWHQEEPFLSASIYLQWCVSRLAQENHTTVLMDGQGADELLAGYQFHFKQAQLDWLDAGRLAHAIRQTEQFTGRLKAASRKYKQSDRRFNTNVAYTADELRVMSKGSQNVSHYPYDAGVAPAKPGYRLRRTLSEALLYNSLPMLLRYADRNSMAFSRESRLPFLDYDLVDFCIRMPDHYWVNDGWQKWILRQSTHSIVPESIRWRADKVGYAAPLDIWLRDELREWGYDRCVNNNLEGLPGYDSKVVKKLWNKHQQGANNSWALWRWISMSEWLNLYKSGQWKAGLSL